LTTATSRTDRNTRLVFLAKTTRTFCYGFLGIKIVYDVVLYGTIRNVRTR